MVQSDIFLNRSLLKMGVINSMKTALTKIELTSDFFLFDNRQVGWEPTIIVLDNKERLQNNKMANFFFHTV